MKRTMKRTMTTPRDADDDAMTLDDDERDD